MTIRLHRCRIDSSFNKGQYIVVADILMRVPTIRILMLRHNPFIVLLIYVKSEEFADSDSGLTSLIKETYIYIIKLKPITQILRL
jgi:hypothetical protein